MSWEICPVCNGRGLVPAGFYNVGSKIDYTYRGTTTGCSSPKPETCRTCKGRGVLYSYNHIPKYDYETVSVKCNPNNPKFDYTIY
ncbi:MAG: hypothetical protein WC476_00910 [Phycisphaerae bacterium]|jgi:DnaJ-class molecular chaperone